MEWVTDLVLLLAILAGLLIGGLWIPIALGLAGLVFLLLTEGTGSFHLIANISWNNVNSFVLTAVPLFVLMGEIVLRSGISTKFYRAVSIWLNWAPGGLLHTNIVACSFMAAVTGSSVATAGAVGSAAAPELRRAGYDPRLVYGSLGAGGSLGILIPPSIIMIIYGALTGESVADLFIAGLFPGLLLGLIFIGYIAVRVTMNRELGGLVVVGSSESAWRVRLRALKDIVPLVIVLVAVISSIYSGWATPTEAGAIGVVLMIFLASMYGGLRLGQLLDAMGNAVRLSSMVIFIIVGAAIVSLALVRSGLNRALSTSVVDMGLSPLVLLLVIGILVMALGMLIDGISIIYLVIPLLLPIVAEAGFNLIWFAVFLTILLEAGQITPPMGLVLFVIKSLSGDVVMRDVIRGALPFVLLMCLGATLLVIFPGVALWHLN